MTEPKLEPSDEVVEALEGLLNIMEHCSVTDGMCCCGDDMATHSDPMNCGHSPVDHGQYVAEQAFERARAAIAAYQKAAALDIRGEARTESSTPEMEQAREAAHGLVSALDSGWWSDFLRDDVGIVARALLTALESGRPASNTPGAPTALASAARAVIYQRFSTYKARNGREVGIQDSSGEMCWIVPFDAIAGLERALSAARPTPAVPSGWKDVLTKVEALLRHAPIFETTDDGAYPRGINTVSVLVDVRRLLSPNQPSPEGQGEEK